VLKAPWVSALETITSSLLLSFAVKFKLHHYTTEKAFLKRILESDARPLPRETPVKSEEYKARNATLKGLTAGAYTRPFLARPQPFWSHLPVSPGSTVY